MPTDMSKASREENKMALIAIGVVLMFIILLILYSSVPTLP